MRITRFSSANETSMGLVVEDGIVDLRRHLPGEVINLTDLMVQWQDLKSVVESNCSLHPDFTMQEVTLLSPIPRPGKIMGIGLNYSDHAAEAKMELPKDQLWFSKAVTTITDPFGTVHLPKVSSCLDYEAELVLVVGTKCRHVAREEAPRVIFGYMVGNDVSVRDWQFKTTQFILGKSFDTHAPTGPWIVTADSLDPHQLNIRCFVNDELRQSSNTRHFIFDCYAMIEHLSQVMTLEPGDLIFTGTPAGVGAVRKPPLYLKAGDRVRTEIEGIGTIENLVVHEPQVWPL